MAAAPDARSCGDLDPAARDLEGYLFPETYPLSRRAEARRARAADGRAASAQVFTPDLQRGGRCAGLTVRQVVTLASLVEKETAQPEERPLVAAVYRNRLRIGMALQCDPTVIYALAAAGRYHGNLTRANLRVRLALQHLPVSRACRRDRLPRRGEPRSRRPCVLRRSTTCTSSAATTARTSSRGRSTSTTATSQ